MPTLTTDDGVKLYYEETGAGTPIVFVHEFARRPPQLGAAGAPLLAPLPLHRLQRARLSAFRRAGGFRALFAGARARRHPLRCSTRSASHARARRRPVDGRVRHAAFRHAYCARRSRARCRSRWPAAATGSHPAHIQQFQAELEALRRAIQQQGHGALRRRPTATAPQRVQLENKDPRGFAEYVRQFEEHSALGSANTLLGVAGAAAVPSTT